MEQKRTIERLWRDAAAAGRPTPAYLIQDGDEWKPLSWAEAAERVESYANGLLSLGVRKGDAFAILGSSRVEWALFDFALGSLAPSAPRSTRTAHRRTPATSSSTRSRSACSARTRPSGPRSSLCAAMPQLRHVLTYADLDDLAARGRAYARRAPERAARGRASDRGERPLHLHLHVRDDRAAEGLHDLAPQLLRDGRGRRRPAELHRAGRHDAPLPPARAQLRPADAPLRRRTSATRSRSCPTRSSRPLRCRR